MNLQRSRHEIDVLLVPFDLLRNQVLTLVQRTYLGHARIRTLELCSVTSWYERHVIIGSCHCTAVSISFDFSVPLYSSATAVKDSESAVCLQEAMTYLLCSRNGCISHAQAEVGGMS